MTQDFVSKLDAGGGPIRLERVAVIRTWVKIDREYAWGDVKSEIHVEPRFAGGLEGIETFSHLVIVYQMNTSVFDAAKDLVRHPRGRQDLPKVGIFAQRASCRPNGLATTSVKLLKRSGPVLEVQGLDALDETPVIDIKPYYPVFDRVAEPKTPEWVDQLMRGYF